ncbi:YdbH domain-containing protein [Hyphomonas sp. WL0036]|uniref:intermembrane phospholipid transport protein YdbH family protein n=1 Tax=Hyphomonas sediminis TaxID=2866160 RepID=UPI001C81E0C2|nr:YdbH domain-containing protein [Hyphomonas sediminis]MBY9065409.1 YdbH domain-containing protein [Hyphomonas sediminis]
MYGSAILLAASSGLVWLLRKPIAEGALEAWCAERDLTCDARFTRIGLGGATLTGVRISSGADVPAEADEVVARLSWPRLFTPRIDGISIAGLEMRGTLDPSGLKFYGLERLAAPSGGGGGEAPPIDIRDARIYLQTPFGPAAATLNVSGQLPSDATASLALDPARLSLGNARMVLGEALLKARIEDGEVTGELRLASDSAETPNYSARGFSLAAEAAFPLDGEGASSLEWSARLASGAAPEASVAALRSRGRAEFSVLPDMTSDSLLSALTLAVAEVEFDSAEASGWSIGNTAFNTELEGKGGNVQGPVSLEAASLSGAPGRAEELRLAGDLTRTADARAAFTGGVQLNGTTLTNDAIAPATNALKLPGVLEAHGAQLSGALSRAAKDFDTAFGLQANLGPGGLVIEADGPSALAAASGFRLEADGPEDGAWLRVQQGQVSMNGRLSLSGGGAPNLIANLGQARLTRETLALEGASIDLAPWSAGGRTISARLSALDFSGAAEGFEAKGQGDFTLTGELEGVTLEHARLSGGLSAVRDETGLRVQADGAPCLAFASGAITSGGITVPRADLNICPVDGRFIRQGRVLGGAARLGDVDIPLAFSGGTGTVGLKGAMVDWTADKGFSFLVSADTLSMPMTLGENTLTIDSGAPEVRIETGAGPVLIRAGLGQTQFGGGMIPANVSARHFGFTGTSAPGGLSGDVEARGVRIADNLEDAVYQPVVGDFAGRIEGQRLVASGPFRIEATGTPVARADASIDIFDLKGTANITSERLVFIPGGFQPTMISQRLVGLFTAAEGEFTGEAAFTIDGGDIQGTADLSVLDFGFQTTRLGRVGGITGSVRFNDLMKLTTADNQQIAIASVNPGVPFSDGKVAFSLENGEVLHLSSVTFPFAGGELALAPMDWSLQGSTPQRVEVTASRIGLTQLIEVLKLPDTAAEGTVSGSFPVEFSPTSVIVRDARLRADEGGRLSYTGGAVNAAAENDPTASLAFNALRDLEFYVLEVGLSGDLAGQMQADVVLAGRNIRSLPVTNGLTMPPGQAFEFNMGFNLPLAQLIEQGLQAANAQAVIDLVSQAEGEVGNALPEPE